MSVRHIPMYGGQEPMEVVMPGALPERATVPLVVYIDGVRRVIGEAVVNGSEITATLGDDISEEVMSQIMGRPDEAHFSLGFNDGPNPFRPNSRPADPQLLRAFQEETRELPEIPLLLPERHRDFEDRDFTRRTDHKPFEMIVPHEKVPDCTCPWNNGYIDTATQKFPHHIDCPALKGTHTPDIKCCDVRGHISKED